MSLVTEYQRHAARLPTFHYTDADLAEAPPVRLRDVAWLALGFVLGTASLVAFLAGFAFGGAVAAVAFGGAQ